MGSNEIRESTNDGRADRDARADASQPSCPGSLVVVSNRQPYRHEYVDGDDGADPETDGGVVDERSRDEPVGSDIDVDRPTGGLTAGLDPVLSRSGGTWIAWGDGDADRDVANEDGCIAVPPDEQSYTLQRVWLSDDAVDGYYYGFSNRVLWPICHEFTELVEHRSADRDWYRRVNQTFADAIADHATDDAVIWLQDYHLALAPAMVREHEAVPEGATIAQFWHIPWPSPDAFSVCPDGRELLEGLLGNDLLAFHVGEYADAFLACVDRFVPQATVEYDSRTVHQESNETHIATTPMGVDAATYDRQSRSLDGSRWRSLRRRYDIPGDVAIGLGVDRLDYSKGIPERLDAIERFFERNPDWRGEFTFVQKSTPSRTSIPAYQDLGEHVRSAVERINARFATRSWRPIVYTEEYLSREELCALYRRADAMIVSPLLDGMNLVAQEYVASSVDGDGTLLLSERAGATATLGAGAFTIDPTQRDEFAATIEAALTAPPDERHRRMTKLRDRAFEHDIEAWMAGQFDAIARVHDSASDHDPGGAQSDSTDRSATETRSETDSRPDSEPTSFSHSQFV